jgi:serine protein kinase
MATATAILDRFRNQLDLTDYQKLNWEGSFTDYLEIVIANPGVTRTAYQRLYDMILAHGVEEVYENKEKLLRYKFFTEFATRHADGIYGLDRPLMQLVNTFKSAALGYGTERRVILLHGPVGSAKSTIARLLKRGIEEYSRTDAGRLFSFAWKNDDGTWTKDPMHSEPLQLVPEEHRAELLATLNENATQPHPYAIKIKGDLSPYSRFEFKTRLAK